MEPLDHAAGYDPDDTTVPALARKYQRGITVGDGLFHALLEDGASDLSLGLLAIGIQLVELRRQRARTLGIFGQEHLDYVRCAVHAAGRVNPGSHAEGDIPRAGEIPF